MEMCEDVCWMEVGGLVVGMAVRMGGREWGGRRTAGRRGNSDWSPQEGLVGGAEDVWTRKLFEAFLSSSLLWTWSPPLHKAISFWCQPYLCSISLGSSRCIHRPPALRDREDLWGVEVRGGGSVL